MDVSEERSRELKVVKGHGCEPAPTNPPRSQGYRSAFFTVANAPAGSCVFGRGSAESFEVMSYVYLVSSASRHPSSKAKLLSALCKGLLK